MELSLVQSVFGAQRGGLLGANLIRRGVCYRPRPLASQPVAKRKVFVFFCLFHFLPFCSLPSSEPVFRAEMETIRGENPHLGFSVG